MKDSHRNRRVTAYVEYQTSKAVESSSQKVTMALVGNQNVPPLPGLDPHGVERPNYALSYLENLIPYSYFHAGGPVLYLRPSRWPFHRPFTLSGAEMPERFGSSVFPRQSIWMSNAFIPDGVVIKGPLLGGDVLSWISHTPECFHYRIENINWVQQRLISKEQSTSDETIGAIMTLTMWENGEDQSLSSKAHMEGLEMIVSLRGGLEAMRHGNRMLPKIILFDFILSVCHHQDPLFSPLPSPQPAVMPGNTSRDLTFIASPIYGNGDFGSVQYEYHEENIVELLQCMWNNTAAVVQPLAGRELNCHFNLTSVTDRMYDRLGDQASKFQVHRVLYYAAMIFQRALLTPAVAFNSYENFSDLEALYFSLNISATEGFWLEYPGLLLWVLLVACAVSGNRKERSYFMMFLAKVGMFTEIRCWPQTQTAILRFKEVQNRSMVQRVEAPQKIVPE